MIDEIREDMAAMVECPLCHGDGLVFSEDYETAWTCPGCRCAYCSQVTDTPPVCRECVREAA